MFFLKKLKKLFCKHNNIKHKRNIYGDEILRLNARSVWKCKDCGRIVYKNKLYITGMVDGHIVPISIDSGEVK